VRHPAVSLTLGPPSRAVPGQDLPPYQRALPRPLSPPWPCPVARRQAASCSPRAPAVAPVAALCVRAWHRWSPRSRFGIGEVDDLALAGAALLRFGDVRYRFRDRSRERVIMAHSSTPALRKVSNAWHRVSKLKLTSLLPGPRPVSRPRSRAASQRRRPFCPRSSQRSVPGLLYGGQRESFSSVPAKLP
jgi:hypothetical protein